MSTAQPAQQQQYGTRNVFYLRLSPRIVLSSTLYLDARHVPWLNAHPSIFHSALGELRDRLVKKLEREAKVITKHGLGSSRGGGRGGKRGAALGGGWTKRLWGEMSGNEQVDVVRKGDFHLAFFFKKMNAAHGVLLKEVEKTFPKQKATTSSGSSSSSKRRRIEDAGVVRLEEEEEGAGGIEVKPDPEDEEANGLGGLPAPGQGLDSDNDEEDDEGFTMHPGAMYEDEDTKPKFKLKVRYNGFQIFPKSLTLVLEPSPSARARSPHLFATQASQERRQLSATPAMMSATRRQGASNGRGQSIRDGSTMRDGSAARGTPLFRGSATPSDAGDEEEEPTAMAGPSSLSGAAKGTTMAPPPVPQRARRAAGEAREDEEAEQAQEAAAERDGDGYSLAEQMLLSQDDVSHFVVNERAADEGD